MPWRFAARTRVDSEPGVFRTAYGRVVVAGGILVLLWVGRGLS